MRQVRCKYIALLLGGVLFTSGCSPGFQSSSSAVSAASTLTITPSSTSVVPYGSVALSASGGTSPYTYELVSGTGTISSTTFVAPSVEETDVVEVIDATGATNSASITVTSSASTTSTPLTSGTLSVTYSPSTVYTGDVVTIEATGGTPPYSYVLSSGSGQLNGNFYTAATSAETAAIIVSDSAGDSVTLTFSVTVGVAASAPAEAVTMITAQVPNTTNNECPSGGTMIGTVAEFYGSQLNHYQGDTSICEELATTQTASQVIADVYISPLNAHRGSPTCPGGYTMLQEIADCGGGSCGGYQSLCILQVDPMSAMTFVADFYITTENTHGAGACNAGYTTIGTTEDCGGGSCSGTQALCVKY